jgi:SAM-dependent methyltransferase
MEAIWHDLECGSYVEDLDLWRELAAEAGADVDDRPAGTGRVALDLAARGIDVVAVDVDDALLAVLRERAADRGLAVRTVCADARELELEEPVAQVLVPMQTLQLLGGPEDRGRFLAAARRVLPPGGLLACALAEALDAFEGPDDLLPLPDMAEHEGTVYSSRPVAVVDEGDRAAIHRLREVVTRAGERTVQEDVVRLSRVGAAELAEEAVAFGFEAREARWIAETDEYVGSVVVVLEAV